MRCLQDITTMHPLQRDCSKATILFSTFDPFFESFFESQTVPLHAHYTNVAFSDSQIGALQAVANTLKAENKPLSILYGPDISGTSNLSTLTDQRLLNAPNFLVCIGKDGAGKVNALFVLVSK